MSAYALDAEWLTRAKAAHALLTEHHDVITNALRCHAEHMSAEASNAQAAYEGGADTPLMTNNGFKQAAEILQHTAEAERQAAEKIDAWKENVA
ncbi:hypothetical protein [Spongiactinospora sp. TRM90649]|uniref:hypothetical protein n=1 Tax=Spongiactinospora sp. TRM90649 TaxID=3031114 RepID=UPI0023F8BC87|nr:hypothetical protein [Spongiactinospora sp. TRM90649]MDF5756554.1 hypothetical protein [Spongiactinospora sp. TRM90649]